MQMTGLKLMIASIAIAATTATSAHAGSFGSNQSFAHNPVFAAFKARSIIKVTARVYGERCVTPKGSCTIHPQPVGSPCRCGNVNGKTLQ